MEFYFLFILTFTGCRALVWSKPGNQFEGDIVLTPNQLIVVNEKNNKYGDKLAAIRSNHWKTNGKTDVIKYYIESSLTSESKAMNAIEKAIKEYHKYTCIRFERVHSKPSGPHISFFRGSGCWSYVGRISNGQQISLARGCWHKGTVMHEMGHALGFFHEHSRPDREMYVVIFANNIQSANLHNFKKYTISRINSLGSKYDYESMMHFGKSYFAKYPGLITIKTVMAEYQNKIGQRNGFSKGDIEQFNNLYCNGVQPVVTTTKSPGSCKNEQTDDNCEEWKNLCNLNDYVKRTCKSTCGLCSTPMTTTRKPVVTTTKSPGSCKNEQTDDNCEIWKNLCNLNDYVKRTCKSTCGLCSTPCRDLRKDDRCNSWKILCSSNEYVQQQCKATCGLC